MIVVDDFIPNFDALKASSFAANFQSHINEVDGAVYPAISMDVPEPLKHEIINRIEEERGFKINPKLMFFRSNELGAKEPYQAHNDLNMADYTCIVYLSGDGGTAFVRHTETGMDRNQPEFADTWARDCNNYDSWEITDICQMKPNRALFFDAELMHRGEPVEGYGKGEESRMILVCFYDRAEND